MAFHSVFLVFLAGLAFCSEAAPPEPLDAKSPLFVKVLDSVRGSPAQNVPVKLYREESDGVWLLLNSNWMLTEALKTHNFRNNEKSNLKIRQTNEKGGIPELTTKEQFGTGSYKLELDTASYWKSLGLNPFHHHADVVFTANDAGFRHYKIVVVISPFSYSTTAVVSEPVE